MPRKRQHPYRKLVLPPNAPFELRPAAPGKGFGAFATRAIPKSTEVLYEQPLISVPDHHYLVTEAQVAKLIVRLSPTQRTQLDLLRIDGDRDRRFTSYKDLMSHNGFVTIDEGNHGARGLQPIASRFNHSCAPNLFAPDNPGEAAVRFVAIEDIAAGTELTFSYIARLPCLTRAERHAELGWLCHCEGCSLPPREQHISDMRRRLTRGLYFLVYGHDVVRHIYSAPGALEGLVPDPALKSTAEKGRILLTSKFVYCVAIFALMEAEGVLNPRTADPLQVMVRDTVTEFKDQAVFEYCDQIMSTKDQTTWSWKFAALSPLFGGVVSGDHISDMD